MKSGLLLFLLAGSGAAFAKKQTMYRCQQSDGTVVVQDRRCQSTNLSKAPKQKSFAKRLNKSNPVKSPQLNVTPKRIDRKTYRKRNNPNATRSPYFTFGWERFIPANWQLQQIKAQKFDQLLMSRTQFKGLNDFREGVKLSVYADTVRQHRQGAFAHALQIYQRIRDNDSYTLLDSQFKSHPNYKVFNIKYLLGNNDLALTEFYIDENHNDLFVLTVQAREASWLPQWQFAERIISQL